MIIKISFKSTNKQRRKSTIVIDKSIMFILLRQKNFTNQTVKIKAVNKIIATICPELKLVKIASIFINILPFYLTINC